MDGKETKNYSAALGEEQNADAAYDRLVFYFDSVNGVVNGMRRSRNLTLEYDPSVKAVKKIVSITGEGVRDQNLVEEVLVVPSSVTTGAALIEYIKLNRPQWNDWIDGYVNKNGIPLMPGEPSRIIPPAQAGFGVDIVFCVERKNSMKPHLGRVKKEIMGFCQDISQRLRLRGECIGEFRAKICTFDAYAASGRRAMLLTEFFSLPGDTAALENCLSTLSTVETDKVKRVNGLEALVYAIRSKWNTKYEGSRLQIIVVWADSATFQLGGTDTNLPCYPKGMPGSMKELTSWWTDGYMDENAKRLVLFAPDAADWNFVSSMWDQVLHFPSAAGQGLSDEEYELIISELVAEYKMESAGVCSNVQKPVEQVPERIAEYNTESAGGCPNVQKPVEQVTEQRPAEPNFAEEERAFELRRERTAEASEDDDAAFPKVLFCCGRREKTDINGNLNVTTKNVVMQEDGTPVVESKSVTYKADTKAEDGGKGNYVLSRIIGFPELEALIVSSTDPNAKKYSGINEDNWKSYFEK